MVRVIQRCVQSPVCEGGLRGREAFQARIHSPAALLHTNFERPCTGRATLASRTVGASGGRPACGRHPHHGRERPAGGGDPIAAVNGRRTVDGRAAEVAPGPVRDDACLRRLGTAMVVAFGRVSLPQGGNHRGPQPAQVSFATARPPSRGFIRLTSGLPPRVSTSDRDWGDLAVGGGRHPIQSPQLHEVVSVPRALHRGRPYVRLAVTRPARTVAGSPATAGPDTVGWVSRTLSGAGA
jgi:hypothetical protein